MADDQQELQPVNSDAAKLAIMSRISLIIDVLLIGGCLYLLVGDFMKALDGVPAYTARGGAFLVNLSATFALVHRSMALMQRFWPAPTTRKWVGVFKWLLALLLPLFVASHIERLVQTGHRAQLDALVAEISTRTTSALATNGQVRSADLIMLHGPYLQTLTVRVDSGAFLLSALVPAVNIDGYSAQYSSTERVWHLSPHGATAETSPVFDAQGPTLVCRRDNERMACERHEP